MKNILPVILLCLPSLVMANNQPLMFGLGESSPEPAPEPVMVQATFGLDVVETATVQEVTWVTETICENGVCRQVQRPVIRNVASRIAPRVVNRAVPIVTNRVVETTSPIVVASSADCPCVQQQGYCPCGGQTMSTGTFQPMSFVQEMGARRGNLMSAWRQRPGLFGWRQKMAARMNGY